MIMGNGRAVYVGACQYSVEILFVSFKPMIICCQSGDTGSIPFNYKGCMF